MEILDYGILREIGAISRAIHAQCDLRYRALGLQKGQFVFLTRICENPDINQIQLSNLVRVDKTTTSRAVRKLEAQGYIAEARNDSDGRTSVLNPTDRARKIYRTLIDDENRNLAFCLKGFAPDEIESIEGFLLRMRENLDGTGTEKPEGVKGDSTRGKIRH